MDKKILLALGCLVFSALLTAVVFFMSAPKDRTLASFAVVYFMVLFMAIYNTVRLFRKATEPIQDEK
ncbi:MAG: hypothetical protein WD712_03265 [Candidatus Spechtbacterales bacterium]